MTRTGNDGTGNNPNSGEQVRVLLANSVYNLESVDEDSFFYVTPNDDLDSTRTRLHGAKFKVDYVDGGSTAKKFVLSYKSSDGSQSYIVVNGHGDRLETSDDKNYAAQWALVAAPSKYREPGGTNAYYILHANSEEGSVTAISSRRITDRRRTFFAVDPFKGDEISQMFRFYPA
ncbi:hypothetical protein CPC08DRAFT_757378 [Agrocybe pediades]|nr:hypothetical protein CPC08DRAFT_757378 [Agrocybe pediades]